MLKHGRLALDRWYHLVNRQTVLGAIQRESYGFQTFFANRVGEIQKIGPVRDWWWVPGQHNVADLLTRGCSLEKLVSNSLWQRGPEFLSKPVEEWPIKSAAEVAAGTRETVSKLQRKSFSAITIGTQAKRSSTTVSPGDVSPKVENDVILEPLQGDVVGCHWLQ